MPYKAVTLIFCDLDHCFKYMKEKRKSVNNCATFVYSALISKKYQLSTLLCLFSLPYIKYKKIPGLYFRAPCLKQAKGDNHSHHRSQVALSIY